MADNPDRKPEPEWMELFRQVAYGPPAVPFLSTPPVEESPPPNSPEPDTSIAEAAKPQSMYAKNYQDAVDLFCTKRLEDVSLRLVGA